MNKCNGVGTWIRRSTVSEDFIEEDTKRPNVRFVGESSVADGLRSAPLIWDSLVFRQVKRLLQTTSKPATALVY